MTVAAFSALCTSIALIRAVTIAPNASNHLALETLLWYIDSVNASLLLLIISTVFRIFSP